MDRRIDGQRDEHDGGIKKCNHRVLQSSNKLDFEGKYILFRIVSVHISKNSDTFHNVGPISPEFFH